MAERRGHPVAAFFLFLVTVIAAIVLGVLSRLAFRPIGGSFCDLNCPHPNPVGGGVLLALAVLTFFGGLWMTASLLGEASPQRVKEEPPVPRRWGRSFCSLCGTRNLNRGRCSNCGKLLADQPARGSEKGGGGGIATGV